MGFDRCRLNLSCVEFKRQVKVVQMFIMIIVVLAVVAIRFSLFFPTYVFCFCYYTLARVSCVCVCVCNDER